MRIMINFRHILSKLILLPKKSYYKNITHKQQNSDVVFIQ